MNLGTGLKTIPISTALITQFIEEKLDQFSFKADDEITNIELIGIPKTILMKVKFQREKEI